MCIYVDSEVFYWEDCCLGGFEQNMGSSWLSHTYLVPVLLTEMLSRQLNGGKSCFGSLDKLSAFVEVCFL